MQLFDQIYLGRTWKIQHFAFIYGNYNGFCVFEAWIFFEVGLERIERYPGRRARRIQRLDLELFSILDGFVNSVWVYRF